MSIDGVSASEASVNNSSNMKNANSVNQSKSIMIDKEEPSAKRRRLGTAEESKSHLPVGPNVDSGNRLENRHSLATLGSTISPLQNLPVVSNNRVARVEEYPERNNSFDGEIALQILERQRLLANLLSSSPRAASLDPLALQLAQLHSAGIARPPANLLNLSVGSSSFLNAQQRQQAIANLYRQESQASQLAQLIELQAHGRGLQGINQSTGISPNPMFLHPGLQYAGGQSSALALALRRQQAFGEQPSGRRIDSLSPGLAGISANALNLPQGMHASLLSGGNRITSTAVAVTEGSSKSIGDGVPLRLPCILARSEDTLKLSSHQVLLRHQIEAFQATDDDISTHTRGRNKPIQRGQVGIRCRHCAHLPVAKRQKGSTYFPATLLGLYQAAQNMSTTHMQCGLCSHMPDSIKMEFAHLISTKVVSSGAGRPYWSESARKLGLVDTDDGIRFVRDLPSGATGAQTVHK